MTTLIVPTRCGQLGNRLVLGGHLLALAAEFDFRLWNTAFSDYAPFFEGTTSSLCCSYPERRNLTPLLPGREFAFRATNISARLLRRLNSNNRVARTFTTWGHDPHADIDLSSSSYLATIQNTVFCFLLGWRFRNYELFHRHADKIRNYFRPISPLQANVDRTFNEARNRGDCVVGVHIRQGDYATFQDGKYFRTTENYAACMRRMEELLHPLKPCFAVTSHVPQDPQYFEGLTCIYGSGHVVEDMYVLAKCDYVLAVPSTYSRWACFYGQTRLAYCPTDFDELTLEDFEVPQH